MTPSSLWAERLRRQGLLHGRLPAAPVVAMVRRLAGLQAQRTARPAVALWARFRDVGPGALEAALEGERRLVRTWCLRGTLHVVPAEDAPVFLAATRDAWFSRWGRHMERRSSFGDREPVRQAVCDALAGGPLDRRAIAARVGDRLGLSDADRAWLFGGYGGVLKELAYLGRICYAGEGPGGPRFALVETWLPGRAAALREAGAGTRNPGPAVSALLHWYLAGHGPATLADFVHWSGLTAAEARAARDALGGDVEELSAGGLLRPAGPPTAEDSATPHAAAGPAVRLLPKFDPLLLAYRDKTGLLDPAHHRAVFRGAADLAAVVLAGGRVAGTWRASVRRGLFNVAVSPFATLDAATRAALAKEAAGLARFLGFDGARVSGA